MGDYSRQFGNKEDAESWANSYKGETVKVHVDSRDPTRSVLREECVMGEAKFQSTRPCGARRPRARGSSLVCRVSIHAPLWGATAPIRRHATS